jgi:hypothetical protein
MTGSREDEFSDFQSDRGHGGKFAQQSGGQPVG